MSDPVTNAEVEDVLSSIRRLVSEDKRPLQSRRETAPSDRLVLTPALRVAGTPAVDVGNAAETTALEATQAVEKPVELLGLRNVLRDAAPTPQGEPAPKAENDPAQDYSDDHYDFSGDANADDDTLDRAPPDRDNADRDNAEAKTAAAPLHLQDTTNADGFDALALAGDTAPAGPASLSEKIEALETAIGKISDTWEPDAAGEDEYSGTDDPAMAWEDEIEELKFTADLTQALEGKAGDDTLEDDAVSGGVFSSSRPHPAAYSQAAKPTPRPDPVASPAAEADTGAQSGIEFNADDQVIDEEALRDLVSEIVRAELQGALGERITRNVRKLVRREIHRALTAKEME
jgi:hypothetical protein